VTRRRRRALVRGLSWLAVLGWAGIIWRLATLPPEKALEIPFIGWGDKLGHVGVFCVWGLLICWAIPRPARSLHRLSRIGVAAMPVLAAAAYGIVMELYQAGIERNADVLDILADASGAVIASCLCFSSKLNNLVKRLTPRRRGRVPQVGRQARSSPSKAHAEGSLEPLEGADGER
jgi:VanZ family protein